MPLTPATSYISGNWRDRLTSYDGQTITYDDIGNPLTYLGYGFTWENGRQLSYIYDEVTFASVAAYEYNGDGIRTAKVVDGVRYEYILDGTQVLAIAYELEETVGSVTYPVYYLVQFTYDESGAPVSMRYIERKESSAAYRVDQTYYYVKNLQGDVVALTNAAGSVVATYIYDAWGNQVISWASGQEWVAEMNPFRYRGYFYDAETGFYYLNSRYYDPEVGRFLNADGQVNIDQGLLGTNMYSYCLNDPVNMLDDEGCRAKSVWSFKSDAKGRAILWHYLYGKGKDFIKKNGSWGKYMMANKTLKSKVQEIVFPIGKALENGTSKSIDMTVSMIIDNGEDIIGYQYLHGTNADVGGFNIKGTISKNKKGNVTYDLTYTWNDMIDPNFIYDSDSKKAAFAKKIPFANPADYYICISWDDKTVIKANGKKNSGWLK